MKRAEIAYVPSSHLDLFWLGNYKTCLERGVEVIRQYLDRCLDTPGETFLLESVVFADYFLKMHPAYRESLILLAREGRVEIGAAYVDRWENLILGESHIRNIQFGKRWCREILGLDPPMVTHPDLPGLVSQIPQIYAQAGLRYYVTSRKIYEQGQVWRHRAPDGSSLLIANYPRHYIYAPMDELDIPSSPPKPWWIRPIKDLETTLAGFPLGTVMASGGAGDLADRKTFKERYGRYLEEFVAANRERYPDLEFTYTIPTQVLAPYDDLDDLPEHSGEIPSVWGVAADEEVAFFRRDRELEGLLLTVETMAVVAEHLGIQWRPPSSSSWQGVFFEEAFFAPKDPIPPGSELRELWRKHLFTQDHNGGGQEGALSSFQKRVIQQRCQTYAKEIIDHTLDQLAGRLSSQEDVLLVFNPHGRECTGPLAVTIPEERWAKGDRILDENGRALLAQADLNQEGELTVQVDLSEVPAVGYRAFAVGRSADPDPTGSSVLVDRDETALRLQSSYLEVTVDLKTGDLMRILDRQRGQDWGNASRVGRLHAVKERGNDVTLRLDPSTYPVEESLLGIDVMQTGPFFTRLRIHKQILKTEVEQTVTLWADQARLDLQTRLYWWGAHNWQIRLGLPSVASTADITYGSPFYGVGWDEVVHGAGPYNRDEILPEDYPHYREVQKWLHLRGARGGLTLCTTHPGFYHGREGLEAVLLRTAPSVGDSRFYWENAGEHIYKFTLLPGEADWRAAGAEHLSDRHFKPPVSRLVRASGNGPFPPRDGFLQVEGDFATLSSLYPGTTADTTVARIYDMQGNGGVVRLTGSLTEAAAAAVNLLEEDPQPLEGQPSEWRVELPAWRIQTVLFTR